MIGLRNVLSRDVIPLCPDIYRMATDGSWPIIKRHCLLGPAVVATLYRQDWVRPVAQSKSVAARNDPVRSYAASFSMSSTSTFIN